MEHRLPAEESQWRSRRVHLLLSHRLTPILNRNGEPLDKITILSLKLLVIKVDRPHLHIRHEASSLSQRHKGIPRKDMDRKVSHYRNSRDRLDPDRPLTL
jgi:hypothetical protein